MLCRTGRIALVIFQAFWFNIVLPGHTRGIIKVPGCPACAAESQEASCPLCRQAAATKSHDPRHAPADPAANCAICAFAATCTFAAPPDLSLPPLTFVRRIADPQPVAGPDLSFTHIYFERGPPCDPA